MGHHEHPKIALGRRRTASEWPTDKPEPVKYWLSNLPEATPMVELVRLGKLRWRSNRITGT